MPEQIDEGRSHPATVTDLLDLQARLRGEPASLVRPKTRVTVEDAPVATPERTLADGDPATTRIEALRRRLASLELEIEAYEDAVVVLRPPPRREGVVLPFRRPGDRSTVH